MANDGLEYDTVGRILLAEELVSDKHRLIINPYKPFPTRIGQKFKVTLDVEVQKPDSNWHKAECQPTLFMLEDGLPANQAVPVGIPSHDKDNKHHLAWVNVAFPKEGKWRLHLRNHKTPNADAKPQWTTEIVFDIEPKEKKD